MTQHLLISAIVTLEWKLSGQKVLAPVDLEDNYNHTPLRILQQLLSKCLRDKLHASHYE